MSDNVSRLGGLGPQPRLKGKKLLLLIFEHYNNTIIALYERGRKDDDWSTAEPCCSYPMCKAYATRVSLNALCVEARRSRFRLLPSPNADVLKEITKFRRWNSTERRGEIGWCNIACSDRGTV